MRWLDRVRSFFSARAPHGHAHGHAHSHPRPGHHRHDFDDPESLAARFEKPERDAWQKPEQVIAALQIPRAGRVADLGAATGYFPVRIARAHPDAIVYGVDVEPALAAYLRERASREGLENLKVVLGSAEDPKLPEPVDVALLVGSCHHIPERPAYFTRLAGYLRPGGRIGIVDNEKLPRETLIEEMRQAGYRLAESHDFLPNQYFLVFAR